MRVHATTSVIAAALVALSLVAGCGDSTNTDIVLGDEPTPTPTIARTSTPVVGRTATPVATATPGTGATATTGSNPTPTATPGSSVDADVQAVVSDLLPFLTAGPSLLSGGSASALTAGSAEIVTSVEGLKNDPCPDGGSRVDDEGLPVRTITLTTCRVSDSQLGSFEFNGTITITISLAGGSIDFDFTSKDLLHNDHTVHFSGSLTGPPQLSGFVLDGQVVVMTPEGNFTLNLHSITINSNHKLVSGSGTASDDDNNFTIDTIAMTVAQGGATANFTVTFDDTSVHTYTLNLTSGQLTQTS